MIAQANVPDGFEDQARAGANNCPERAITLVDSPR